MTTYNFCPHCGAHVMKGWNFCEFCGRRLVPAAHAEVESAAPAFPPAPPSTSEITVPAKESEAPLVTDAQTAPSPAQPLPTPVTPSAASVMVSAPLRNRLSVERVSILSLASNGLYGFYWLYITWKHYGERTGAQVYPVWHALTLFVPIYGLFRMHAHARVYRDLMSRDGVPTTISPGWAVVILLTSQVISGIALRLSLGPEVSENLAVVFLLELLSLGIITWLLVHLQRNLNAYWAKVAGNRLQDAPFGLGEIILAVLGALLWLSALTELRIIQGETI